MTVKSVNKAICSLVMVGILCVTTGGCSVPQAGVSGIETPAEERQSSVYGDWQNSDGLLEGQLLQGSGTASSGVSGGAKESTETTGSNRFRNTENGEPLAIHEFVNRVLVDTEQVTIMLQAKTADALGDAGFTLMVENHYRPLTPVGYDNYCYITPIMGTWTVNGVKMDPKTEGNIYPAKPGIIYLYFDELSSIDELTSVEGSFEIYLISDWWNPIEIYEFDQA